MGCENYPDLFQIKITKAWFAFNAQKTQEVLTGETKGKINEYDTSHERISYNKSSPLVARQRILNRMAFGQEIPNL